MILVILTIANMFSIYSRGIVMVSELYILGTKLQTHLRDLIFEFSDVSGEDNIKGFGEESGLAYRKYFM